MIISFEMSVNAYKQPDNIITQYVFPHLSKLCEWKDVLIVLNRSSYLYNCYHVGALICKVSIML